ncbi:MAG: DUF72 domain-containing protein [Chloroflexales bacterium]|nr:DUF72 domain-containing protein [Chloroflexales bacterium]
MFLLGCAIWAYKDWVGELFPPGSKSGDFLRLYSRRLTAVEGNTTFYAVPRPDMVARWAAETPEHFRFCFKLPREVSHGGPLLRQIEATRAFVERMAPLGPRLGPFFLQLPPGYSPAQRGDLARWLEAWPGGQRVAVEVRHPDWYAPAGEAALMGLLERHGAGRVVMDVRPIRQGGNEGGALLDDARERKPDVPMRPLRSGGIAIVRYIGHPEPARNEVWLDEWARRIAAWLAEGTAVYCFMHCPDEARSPALCRAIQSRLERMGAAPPLPWAVGDHPPGPPEQLSLF